MSDSKSVAQAEVDHDINSTVRDGFEKDQREAILRRQMQSIREELGEGSDDEIAEYRTKLSELAGTDDAPGPMPAATVAAVHKELDRLERMGDQSMESGWIRSWLETIFELPWGERTDDTLDLAAAQEQLDADHTGLDKVKERIVEFLAVRKLQTERQSAAADATEGTPPKGRRGSGAIHELPLG